MLPASLGPASKESIKITKCCQTQIQSNGLFLTAMTKQYRGKQWSVSFFLEMAEKNNWFLQRQFTSEDIFQSFPFMLQFFFSPSCFLCLLSKTTWANIASCHIKAVPCILQRGEFCSWMERHSSQTPNRPVHAGGVKIENRKHFFYLNQSLCLEDKPIIAQWRKFTLPWLNK